MKKFWKIIKYLFCAAGAVIALSLAIVIGIGQWRRPVGQADAIIVLGAAIKTPAAKARALEGLRLYQEGKAPVLVLSGGVDYPKSISEAQYMENVVADEAAKEVSRNPHPDPLPSAVAKTMADKEGEGGKLEMPNIILETNSQSTFENIQNSKKLLPNARSVIIVSDTYHLARAVITARLAGFSPVYWRAPEAPEQRSSGELIFHYLREAAALIDYAPKFALGR